jgi:hypothetical protein
MAKQIKPALTDNETVITDKSRTTPIAETITKITGMPVSAIVYRCAASSYWQFRVFLEGKQRKRSTKQIELLKAKDTAKVIYAEMLLSVNAGEIKLFWRILFGIWLWQRIRRNFRTVRFRWHQWVSD